MRSTTPTPESSRTDVPPRDDRAARPDRRAERAARRAQRRDERRARRAAHPQRVSPPRHAAMWLTIALAGGLVLAAAGIAIGTATGLGLLVTVSFVLAGASIVGPIAAAGWMIARAIRRGAGVLGLLFAAGMIAAGVGQFADQPPVMFGGWAAMILAAAALYLVVAVPAWRAEAHRRERRELRAAARRERRAEAVRRGAASRR
jgi:peptidoglycan/LPS O-acetylase OafA/YrhL